jgi:hypothetical protein
MLGRLWRRREACWGKHDWYDRIMRLIRFLLATLIFLGFSSASAEGEQFFFGVRLNAPFLLGTGSGLPFSAENTLGFGAQIGVEFDTPFLKANPGLTEPMRGGVKFTFSTTGGSFDAYFKPLERASAIQPILGFGVSAWRTDSFWAFNIFHVLIGLEVSVVDRFSIFAEATGGLVLFSQTFQPPVFSIFGFSANIAVGGNYRF